MVRNGCLLSALPLAATLVAGLLTAPARGEEKRAEKGAAGKSAPYVHAVVFYVKKDAPDGEDEALIADAHKLLGKIPSVRELRVGRPAEKATPEFAKKDYQVGLMILFDDFDGLSEYLKHPLHLEYVAKHRKHLENILVYDFENQKK